VGCVDFCSPYKITATSSFLFFCNMFSLSVRHASKSHQVSPSYECKVVDSKFFGNVHSFFV
jgi:hypothetical protein